MGTTGRFGGGAGWSGPKHTWYDTDYSELYKGLAVVIGFFLFLVLLLLIFILISYLRKWWRLKKHGSDGVAASSQNIATLPTGPHQVSSVKNSMVGEETLGGKYPKRYSKSGLVQPGTPPVKSALAKGSGSVSSTPKGGNGPAALLNHNHSQNLTHQQHQQHQQQYHQNLAYHNQQQGHYQEFPPTGPGAGVVHFAPSHNNHSGAGGKENNQNMVNMAGQRTSRPSLATITLT